MRSPNFRPATIWLLILLVGSALLGGILQFSAQEVQGGAPNQASRLATIPFDGARAFTMLERICALGPRISGSEGMRQQQVLLEEHFRELGAEVRRQSFEHRHPESGAKVELANLIVQWHPDRQERILLCAHYDTRPYADQDPDPRKRREPVLGANDGGSGVAILAELGRRMKDLNGPIGVDFVFFDAEEFVFEEKRDPYFLGSEHFARDYKANPPGYRYKYAVLLDMVGDKDLRIHQEQHSLSWSDSEPLVREIWRTAHRLGVREFIPRGGRFILDDHLALHNIAGIPACDLIDFDYGTVRPARSYWHTVEDTPDKCSPLSLAKVGWVLSEWLKQVR